MKRKISCIVALALTLNIVGSGIDVTAYAETIEKSGEIVIEGNSTTVEESNNNVEESNYTKKDTNQDNKVETNISEGISLINEVPQVEEEKVQEETTEVLEDLVVSSNLTLTEDIKCNNLKITAGTLDLNGHEIIAAGNVEQSGGSIKVNEGKLNIKGDYNLTVNGRLVMNNEKDYVLVEGNVLINNSINTGTYYTNGILEIKGNLSEKLGN